MGKVVLCCAALLAACGASAVEPLEKYVRLFLADDGVETKTNAIPNAAALAFLEENIPYFECPDKEIERAYYFRWWTYRHHIKRTPSGYVITEFLPDVSWAGKHNTINCAAGHHILEGRWLRDPQYVDDYARFWFREGTMNGPRAYVCWPAWALLERTRLTGDWGLVTELLGDFVKNYELWEKGWQKRPWPYKDPNEKFDMGLKANGLFATTDDREGSENSLGGDGFRPLVNSAMCGEARAIAAIARHAGDAALAARYEAKADALLAAMREKLWHPGREFFTVVSADGEHKTVRELFGYSPWYFGLHPAGCGAAWKYVMRTDAFLAPCGLANPEQSAPGFVMAYRDLTRTACRRDAPTWPYETSIVLTALANALQAGADTAGVTAADYALLLRQYAAAHKLVLDDGRVVSWIDENWDPFTGDWVARRIFLLRNAKDRFGRGKDYNHSTFCDLVLSGLCGIRPKSEGGFDLKPLAPKEWDHFRLWHLRVQGKEVEVIWDRTGEKYGRGKGLSLFVDGRRQ